MSEGWITGWRTEHKPENIICLDTETTGNTIKDEILQLSIIDGNGNILFNHLIKPDSKKSWPEAEKVNHIHPYMLLNERPFSAYRLEVIDIIAEANMIVGYNLDFDLGFIRRKCKETGEDEDYQRLNKALVAASNKYDVMLIYAPIAAEWNEYFSDFKWQNLSTCADALGYDWNADNGAPHDSLCDCRATLYCFNKLADMDLPSHWKAGGRCQDEKKARKASISYSRYGGWFYFEAFMRKLNEKKKAKKE